MDHYHIWVNLRDSHRDLRWSEDVAAYLGHLQARGWIERWSLARRKLGLGPQELGEFHITISARDLAQLEACFQRVAERRGDLEKLHAAVYGQVSEFRAGLTRDFPDPARVAPPRA